MTRKQTKTIMALDSCLVSIENRALQIENVGDDVVIDLVAGLLKQVKKATKLLEQVAKNV